MTSQTVRYRERLWVPWWWWPLGAVPAVLIALEVNQAAAALPDGQVELWAGPAHLPSSVIARCAEVPRTAKSAALGRQLDPAAYVLHRSWVGPMVLAVLDDPDDPTPYWLVSCRHPDRVLSALRS